jgi:hypothetical protein
VQGLESAVGVAVGAGTYDNFGESIRDTLNTCYIPLGRPIQYGICNGVSLPMSTLFITLLSTLTFEYVHGFVGMTQC